MTLRKGLKPKMFLTSNLSGKFCNMKYKNFQYVTRRQLLWKKEKKQHELESKLKILEKSLSCDKIIEEYHKCKADLDEIYDNIAEGVKIRTKCHLYEGNEKSTKNFLYLKKMQAEKSTIRRLVTDKKDLVKHNRSSRPVVFLGKGVLKICFKLTGEYPCRSVF